MKIGCVLLASGLAVRFGRNKLLERIAGKTLIERTLDALPVSLFSSFVVVTAYDEIEEIVRGRNLDVVRNPRPETGIGSTIKLGVAAMEETDACMICVGDQPYMRGSTLRRMVQDYTGGILAVSHNGEKGNPVIFPRTVYPELLAIEDNCSGRDVMQRHMEHLTLFPVENDEELIDIDFEADIKK